MTTLQTAREMRLYVLAMVANLFAMLRVTPGSDSEVLRAGLKSEEDADPRDTNFASQLDTLFGIAQESIIDLKAIPLVKKESLCKFAAIPLQVYSEPAVNASDFGNAKPAPIPFHEINANWKLRVADALSRRNAFKG
eukprot:CAMPEP_0176350794 /NCGR_PEP_ID=MMETSP0126-20121128/9745_1 /TAXON_ID=141414 ORGANISM="Strombidinopsis acuminatum, Strain SPMC142" /NCGR_SAMPLE_ID=MMETSP0126 /ASSEMBLY_ACC=CAM_ASM_000229 /LENGTH=136 /DNA_ID=CAMNT_0017700989 /DNA_START=423 /DNA_END=833 /DNA_ORIENTATION=-